jgi:hypothetical protein
MKKPTLAAAGLIVLSGILCACSRQASAPAPPVAPAPLTSAQQQAVLTRGKAIAAETFGLLSTNLQNAIVSGGVSNALPYCSLAASPLTASMAERHGVQLRRITHRPRNAAARATTDELAILEGFRASLTASNPPAPFVTNLVPGQATFFAPIVLSNALCLNCHGIPEQDIHAPNLAVIRQLYPQDEATGFRLGELRGAWRIDFPLSSLGQ